MADVSVQAGGAAAASLANQPKPLPIAPTGREVSEKFPADSDSIVRKLNGGNGSTTRPAPAVSQSLKRASLENIISRGESLSVIA